MAVPLSYLVAPLPCPVVPWLAHELSNDGDAMTTIPPAEAGAALASPAPSAAVVSPRAVASFLRVVMLG